MHLSLTSIPWYERVDLRIYMYNYAYWYPSLFACPLSHLRPRDRLNDSERRDPYTPLSPDGSYSLILKITEPTVLTGIRSIALIHNVIYTVITVCINTRSYTISAATVYCSIKFKDTEGGWTRTLRERGDTRTEATRTDRGRAKQRDGTDHTRDAAHDEKSSETTQGPVNQPGAPHAAHQPPRPPGGTGHPAVY